MRTVSEWASKRNLSFHLVKQTLEEKKRELTAQSKGTTTYSPDLLRLERTEYRQDHDPVGALSNIAQDAKVSKAEKFLRRKLQHAHSSFNQQDTSQTTGNAWTCKI